jgi:hypothetical protein
VALLVLPLAGEPDLLEHLAGLAVAQHQQLVGRARRAPAVDDLLPGPAVGVEHRQGEAVRDAAVHLAPGVVHLPQLAAELGVGPHDPVAVEVQEPEPAVAVERVDAAADVELRVAVEREVAGRLEGEPVGLGPAVRAAGGQVVHPAQAVAVHLHPLQLAGLAPGRRQARRLGAPRRAEGREQRQQQRRQERRQHPSR